MPPFIPRPTFPTLPSLPRSYFLGHHRAGLTKMKTMLSSIDLVIECRDYRLPLTSRNPLFEETLAGRKRLVVYTKQDLGSMNTREDEIVCAPLINKLRPPSFPKKKMESKLTNPLSPPPARIPPNHSPRPRPNPLLLPPRPLNTPTSHSPSRPLPYPCLPHWLPHPNSRHAQRRQIHPPQRPARPLPAPRQSSFHRRPTRHHPQNRHRGQNYRCRCR